MSEIQDTDEDAIVLENLYEICKISPTLSRVVVLAALRGEYVPDYSWEEKLVSLSKEEKKKLLKIAGNMDLLRHEIFRRNKK